MKRLKELLLAIWVYLLSWCKEDNTIVIPKSKVKVSKSKALRKKVITKSKDRKVWKDA